LFAVYGFIPAIGLAADGEKICEKPPESATKRK
jgi:hypothetical protein